MTDEDLVTEFAQKQERTRTDIRSLADAVSLLRKDVAENTALLQQVVKFQAAQDEREARQIEIAKDVARIAHSVTSLVEGMHVQNQELTGLLRDLRLHVASDKTMETMIVKIQGAGIAIDEQSN